MACCIYEAIEVTGRGIRYTSNQLFYMNVD